MRAFPDVTPGDRLTGLATLQGATRFFHNGRQTAPVADPEFGRLFFGIWLSPHTSEPDLRRAVDRAGFVSTRRRCRVPTGRRQPVLARPGAGVRYGALGLPLAFLALPLYVVLPSHYAQQYGVPLATLGACCSPRARSMRCSTRSSATPSIVVFARSTRR